MRKIEELRSDYNATLFDIRPWYGGYIGMIHLSDCGTCSVVWRYNEDGYEHVSISPKHKNRMPSWYDMAQLKDIFFYPEEEAYQIMPKRSEYVNVKENCLHIYRPTNGRLLSELIENDKDILEGEKSQEALDI